MPPWNHSGTGTVPTQSQTPSTPVSTQSIQINSSQPFPATNAQTAGVEQETIWKGDMEWHMKDGQGDKKVSHCVTFAAASKKVNGVTEVDSNNWPAKLVLQLIPNNLQKDVALLLQSSSKRVNFVPEKGEKLDILTNMIMSQAGFVAFVHIPGPCDIKVLILAYSIATDSFSGLIPDDQEGFIGKIKTIIKDLQATSQPAGQSSSQQPTNTPSPVVTSSQTAFQAFQASLVNQTSQPTSQPTNSTTSVQSSASISTIRPCEYAQRVKDMEKYVLPLKKKIKDNPVSHAKLNRLLEIISTPHKRLVTRGVLDICELSLKKIFKEQAGT